MNARRTVALGCLALSVWAGGCGSLMPKFDAAFNPALFPAATAPAPARVPGRVALLVRPAAQDFVHEGTQDLAKGMRLSLGRIVEEALLAATGEAVREGVQRTGTVPAAEAGFTATLVLEAVRADHDSKLAWLLPLPVYPFVVGDRDNYARLSFDLSLLDAEGRTVWTRSYDSGSERHQRPSFWSSETVHQGFQRMAHEAAMRLARKAAVDLQDSLADLRNRPRLL